MSGHLLLRRPDDDGFILIEGGVVRIIDKFRQRSLLSPESGGILLGYRRECHLHITAATTPLSVDKSSRTRFFRTAESHQRAANKLWRESNGTIDYVGEWHTHPEVTPSPSMIDRRGWERICNSRSLPMLFIIAGMHDHLWIGLGAHGNLHRVYE